MNKRGCFIGLYLLAYRSIPFGLQVYTFRAEGLYLLAVEAGGARVGRLAVLFMSFVC